MLPKYCKTLSVAVLICSVGACTVSPPVRFYVLQAHAQPTTAQPGIAKKPVIGIGPLSIPALLERKQMVARSDENTVELAEFDQWAEPLRDNVMQVLTQNLAAQVEYVVRPYPWSAYGPVNYHVVIDIDRFDTWPGHSVSFKARWSIIDDKAHAVVSNHRTVIEQPLSETSYAAGAKALSAVLHQFSQELASALNQL